MDPTMPIDPAVGPIWPFLLFLGLAAAMVGGVLVLSHLAGERHRGPGRDQPYESGIEPTGDARLRYGAQYYVVAILFLLFDVEAIYVYAWAVVFRALGWFGLIEAGIFILVLLLGLAYAWQRGVLDWGPAGRGPCPGGERP